MTGCMPELIAAWADKSPEAVAVVAGDQELTYRELDDRANQVGRHLRERGAGPDSVVGLYAERSLDMIVGLLGILKAGAAYLPLDVSLPRERLELILPDLVVTQQALASRLAGRTTVCLEEVDGPGGAFGSGLDPANLAYVIYTSGSTGVPKGIMIEHRALADRIAAKAQAYGITPGDRILQFTSLGFDAAADEIYPTLISGATLVVHPAPKWTSPPELVADCRRWGVTGVMLPPVYLQLLVDTLSEEDLDWLRLFITGGESIPVERLAAFARMVPHRPRFFYAYGPTEATIAATMYEPPMDPAAIERLAKVPIGEPLTNTGLYVLDSRLQPVAEGELWITGTGLARGYVGDPALTAERFVPCPFEPNARMYRTGDLVRRTATGDLEFIGRADDQVKIRGYRVDLGDVEAALTDHPDLGSVVVVYDSRLVAYCVPRPGAQPVRLREYLHTKLPEYMIPAAFVLLDALPLAPGGKVDRQALPRPPADSSLEGGAASSPIEALLTDIWCSLLRRDRIGVTENFFAAGGDSLLANQVVARIREELDIQIPLRDVFDHPTIAALATAITESDEILELLGDIEQMPGQDVPG
jgi:amino acid adenylation domain-containing protein